jgi:hypothetical protein
VTPDHLRVPPVPAEQFEPGENVLPLDAYDPPDAPDA